MTIVFRALVLPILCITVPVTYLVVAGYTYEHYLRTAAPRPSYGMDYDWRATDAVVASAAWPVYWPYQLGRRIAR